jgi:hypothetical protein
MTHAAGKIAGRKAMRVFQLAGIAVFGALGLASCVPAFVEQNETGLIMRISAIEGQSASQEPGNILFSDVSDGFNDNAGLTIDVHRKNPTVTTSTPLEDVLLERYEVRYFRSDGRNTEGVDVPFRFTGPLNGILHAPTGVAEPTLGFSIVVVRHQSKFEPPLKNLLGIFNNNANLVPQFAGAGIITCIAEITIHGRNLRGQGLSAQARLEVVFADFADQQ